MQKHVRTSILAIALTIGISTISTSTSASPVYTGQVCSTNVEKLTSQISWSRNLDDVKEEAAKENKLIVWIHMVGKLDGFT